MDGCLRVSLYWIRSWFTGRVQAISGYVRAVFVSSRQFKIQGLKIRRDTLWKPRKRLFSALLLGSSLLLGVWANELSELEAIKKWERTHLPSERLFEFAMGSRGLRGVSEPRQLQKLIRSITTHLDATGSVWLSSDLNWVAFYSNPDQGIQVQFYCLECLKLPQNWQPVGIGWLALEQVTGVLDQRKSEIHLSAVRNPKTVFRDPREVVY